MTIFLKSEKSAKVPDSTFKCEVWPELFSTADFWDPRKQTFMSKTVVFEHSQK